MCTMYKWSCRVIFGTPWQLSLPNPPFHMCPLSALLSGITYPHCFPNLAPPGGEVPPSLPALSEK